MSNCVHLIPIATGALELEIDQQHCYLPGELFTTATNLINCGWRSPVA